jgi:signal transduction histidine kinase/CheY-like chemotaxis protein
MDFVPAIRDVLVAIRQERPLQEVMSLILESTCTLAHASQGSFIQLDPKKRELHINCVHGEAWTEEKQGLVLKYGQGITGRVAETGAPVLCTDVSQEPEYIALFDHVGSELAVPVFVEDKIWGILNMDADRVNAFDASTLTAITVFAELAASAIGLRLEIDRQTRLQQELLQAEKLASLGRIVASIAHEINNPLTAILGHASLLEMESELPAALRSSTQAIISETERAAALVKDLLGFARKDAGKKELADIHEIVAQACSLIKFQLKMRHIRLVKKSVSGPVPVEVNRQQIQQLLLILLHNAEQAIPDSEDGQIQVVVRRLGTRVSISIKDNGVGIPEDIQERIFEPFFTTKPVGKGTGLGLSLGHTIIETHGGSIKVCSRPGDGAEFIIDLPLALNVDGAEEEMPVEASDSTLSPLPDHAGRVLLVDDESQILDFLARFLNRHGYLTMIEGDGERALVRLKAESFDAVVSDMRMPGMDGWMFFEEAMKVDPAYAEKFIFISGDLVSEASRRRLRESQCRYFEKPFRLEALREAVAEVVANQAKSTA